MKHYYKIIWPVTQKITPDTAPVIGQQIIASSGWTPCGIVAPEPVFHFCDNAIDCLMWYWEFNGAFDCNGPTLFYEVKPNSSVYKSRCPDETQLYQCGANRITYVRRLTLPQIYFRAQLEVKRNRKEIITRYPNYEMGRLIAAIPRHPLFKYLRTR